MCRLGGADATQRANYSGHKKMLCLGYQTATVPDGLIAHLHRPQEGRQPDVVMYQRDGMEEVLRDKMVVEGKQYCTYGNAAYPLLPCMCAAHPRRSATADQVDFNVSMNAVRAALEWSYGDVKQLCTSQDFKRSIKLRRSPVGDLYVASVFLHIFRVCLGCGGQTSHYFQLRAPTLEYYVNH